MLVEHVLAGDAEVGGAVLHVGRRVGRAHEDQAHVGAARGDDELARGLRILGRRDARGVEQRQRFVEDPALGQRERDAGHGARDLFCKAPILKENRRTPRFRRVPYSTRWTRAPRAASFASIAS